jgi:hypothetical protein
MEDGLTMDEGRKIFDGLMAAETRLQQEILRVPTDRSLHEDVE